MKKLVLLILLLIVSPITVSANPLDQETHDVVSRAADYFEIIEDESSIGNEEFEDSIVELNFLFNKKTTMQMTVYEPMRGIEMAGLIYSKYELTQKQSEALLEELKDNPEDYEDNILALKFMFADLYGEHGKEKDYIYNQLK